MTPGAKFTAFTDEDLKRLKEEKDNHDSQCANDCLWKEFKLKALLARLEACEIALATPHKNTPHTKYSQCKGCLAVDRYLKTAGKK